MKSAVLERLTELNKKFGGWSVDEIIADARKKDSPLHDEYVWDKNAAHEIYLRERTRKLIRDWYIVQNLNNDEVVRVRGAISIAVENEKGVKGRRYYPLDTVLSDIGMRRAMLADALRELTSFKNKYRHLTELAEVFAAIDATISKSTVKKSKKNEPQLV